jgi:hypothetical protein
MSTKPTLESLVLQDYSQIPIDLGSALKSLMKEHRGLAHLHQVGKVFNQYGPQQRTASTARPRTVEVRLQSDQRPDLEAKAR